MEEVSWKVRVSPKQTCYRRRSYIHGCLVVSPVRAPFILLVFPSCLEDTQEETLDYAANNLCDLKTSQATSLMSTRVVCVAEVCCDVSFTICSLLCTYGRVLSLGRGDQLPQN